MADKDTPQNPPARPVGPGGTGDETGNPDEDRAKLEQRQGAGQAPASGPGATPGQG